METELDFEEELLWLLNDGPLTTMKIWNEMRTANWEVSYGETRKSLRELVRHGKLKVSYFRGPGGGQGAEYILAINLGSAKN